jgi:hypothetical protein
LQRARIVCCARPRRANFRLVRGRSWRWSAILLMAGSLVATILQPAALYSVHVALEHLVE